MGAEFLSVRRSAVKMVALGSIVLAVGYVITTAGILMSTPLENIDPVTGVIGSLDAAGIPGLMPLAAVALAVVMVIALTTYQSAYARLIFVSGIERHLPRLFTHLNPRTRNPVTAVLVQGVISSTMIVVLYSQSSLATMFLYLQGALTVVWLACGSSSSCRWRSPAGSTPTATPPRTSGASPAAGPPRCSRASSAPSRRPPASTTRSRCPSARTSRRATGCTWVGVTIAVTYRRRGARLRVRAPLGGQAHAGGRAGPPRRARSPSRSLRRPRTPSDGEPAPAPWTPHPRQENASHDH